MNTIYIFVNNLIAMAEEPATIVSDNTGYQIEFDFDSDWDGREIKTAIFVWYRDSLPYCRTVPFTGDTVTVPQLPAVGRVLVGVSAGDLQTTTPAELKCLGSILSQGGQLPQAPTPSEYAQIMALISESHGASAYDLAAQNGFAGTESEWLASLAGTQGPAGADGQDGADGYTPVKGVDYFTEEDKAELVQAVLDALPDGDAVSY